MKKFQDFATQLNEDGHVDVPSARRAISIIADQAEEILEELEGVTELELPSWWMSKIYRAKETIGDARDYLLYPEEKE